ncbi:polymorphic toxin-type HINT domain-containing protein [Streptosporangium sp. NPDC000396]|uniref:polymorphic toxin-type HINT domain-containing protein n=1 Tax=Streptosporangium sp. NPDC000396 TaxID=3366185 RepID=UPI0036838CA4
MGVRRARLWATGLAASVAVTVLVSGVGVPEKLVGVASAVSAAPGDEPSVDGRAVPKPKVGKGAEDSAPPVRHKDPVWPTPGRVEVDLSDVAGVRDVAKAPVRIGPARGKARTADPAVGKVGVETLAPDAVRRLGGVGLGVRLTRADGNTKAGTVRAELSYDGFRDAFGGNFAERLKLVRFPACASQASPGRDCKVRPEVVPSTNDVTSGMLAADVEVSPAASAGTTYALMAGVSGPSGSFAVTDLKPSGAWQAGKPGGSFSYDYPLPEPPSPAGTGPDLSLEYDASSLDGQGSWTNNQSGAVGAGWDLSAGFIERRYSRCTLDWTWDNADIVWSAQEGAFGSSVCWESPDANDGQGSTNDATQSELVLHAGGRSSQIVKDRVSGQWKTVPEAGWKVEEVAGGADGQPYWKITTQEGEVYRFGFTKDAQWQLPYIGNDPGEPCYNRFSGGFSQPTCVGVWRWNLDQEIDPDENVVDYAYTREQNWFCLPGCSGELVNRLPYDRGGVLSKAEWGHNTQVAGSSPTSRTTFITVDRGTTDVPSDLRCDTQTGCANAALAFFVTKRLASVLTEAKNPSTGSWDPVDELSFSHQWIYTRTDFGAPYDPVLWLDTVRHTGRAGGSIALPATDFDAVMLAGKMSYDDVSDWTDQLSWRMVPRIGAIANGMGGRTEVTYGQADPCSGGKGRDGSNYHADHTGDCYKIDQSIDGNTAWTVYYKQLVTKVTEKDTVAASPDMVTSYEYLGSPGWASPVNYAAPGVAPPLTDWRGYATVRTSEGSGTDPAGYTVTSATYFRGMGGSVTNFEGGTATDVRALQGSLLQEQTWKMTALSPAAYSEVDSTRYEYAVVSTGDGPGVHDPAQVLSTRERGRELLTGGSWRYTDEKTAYNADGLPIKINDYGQDGLTTDNSCVSVTYARNTDPGQWMIAYPSVTEKRAGDDCAAGTLIGKSVTLYDGGTDPATNKPTDGNATESRFYANATTVSTAKATYDDYGRTLTAVDPRGKTTTTGYSPAVGWPANGVTVTNPLGHAVTTKLSHVHGEATSVIDANNKKVEIDYDALGRTTTLWGPGQPRSGGTPSATVAYELTGTAPAKTTVKRLLSGSGTGAKWLTSHTFDDGFGRQRETQTASPAGGRVVTVTTYDPRGLTAAESDPVHNASAAGSGLLNPVLTDLSQWSKTVYDGLERPVADIDYHLGTELRRTTTAYPGADRVETTPPVGAKTASVLDAFDQTVKVEEWADATTHHDTVYAYDLDGNLTKMTDAKGGIRTFTFDWLGRRTAATDPDSGNSSTGYDAAGNLAWAVDGKNQKISYSYDDLGRRTVQWAGEETTGTKLAEWTYDTLAKGQPTAAIRYTGGQAYTQAVTGYDADYRPIGSKVTIPASEGLLGRDYEFTSGYDAAGNLTEQNLPAVGGLSAEKLIFGYTDLGLSKSLISDYGGGFTYVKDTAYTATGRLSERVHGANGQVKRGLTWDDATGLVKRVTTVAKADTASPQTAQNDEFFYDTAGQITRILDAVSAVPGGTDGQSECYTYDGRRRLKAAFTTTGSSCASAADGKGIDPYNQAYAYDAIGNITSLTEDGVAATYTYPTGTVRPNAVTSITRPGGTDTYTYDNNGQITGRTVAGKQATFDWDGLGRLTKAVVDGQQTSMVYDASGERLIRRDPDGSVTLYLGATELTLANGAVAAKRYYAGADGSSVAMRTSAGVTWMLSGLHGNSQIAINDTTGTVSRERYLPFGKRRGGDDLPFTDRGFLGKIEDESTGLTYLSARYYDPSIAKFISPDPILDLRTPEFANPYGYAGNNPIWASDPDGQQSCSPDYCPQRELGHRRAAANTKNKQLKKTYTKAANKAARSESNRYKKHYQKRDKAQSKYGKKEAAKKKAEKKKWPTDRKLPKGWGYCNTAIDGTLECSSRKPPKEIPLWAKPIIDRAVNIYGMLVTAYACGSGNKEACTEAIKASSPLSKRRTPRPCSSFVPGTKVLMADGSLKPIEEIKVGDKVLATDPETGKIGPRVVVTPISSEGPKMLVQITVDIDGKKGEATGAITATNNHPFWVEKLRTWVPAEQLKPGMWLRTSSGTYVQVSATIQWTVPHQHVHNLTVEDLHTYYVLAGETPVLVHNNGGCWKTRYEKAGDLAKKYTEGQSTRDPASQWYHEMLDKDELLNGINKAAQGDGIVVSRNGKILGGHHRWDELQARIKDGSIDPDTLIRLDVYGGE